MNITKTRVYISGALTGIDNLAEIRAFYENIGLICKDIGLQTYVPHLNTDPVLHANITPQQVFETDKHHVSEGDLVIAYIGYPSLGVGMELAYAEINSIPIILLYEIGKEISRFPRGIPTIFAEIKFSNYDDAFTQIKTVVEQWRCQHLTKSASPPSYST
ncbi:MULTISPECIES: XRE family transcriptional regulator [Calothrix]|uniref:XRE family transcriptional regulator n=2 Tax=Calothrix TaxID=1186 RepID=A0ABR8A4S3_9CYAN|nr:MULTISPECIES: XRE family transcriptional regulator [Calothrix]MBD2194957.1 XRE family transcriptional regulator [Calothrix parietina FACHB-288]MBD2223555.1 XRE family transcriptional regulator [Calothrix anomala FACHB-343]